MKPIKHILLLITVILAVACNKIPVFPDPGLDSARSKNDTVRRDTIDYYNLSMHVKAPNGVQYIKVLNAKTYDVISEFTTEYAGQKDFTFNYQVDLRAIKKDTTMNFVIKVLDNDNRSYNKGFSLVVKDFSKPLITIVGVKDILGVVSPIFDLKVFLETGLIPMKSMQITFDGKSIYSQSFTEPCFELKLSQTMKLALEKDRLYDMSVELTDEKGAVGVRSFQVQLIESKRPYSVTVSDGKRIIREMFFHYNENNTIKQIVNKIYQRVNVDGYEQIRITYRNDDFFYDAVSGKMTSYNRDGTLYVIKYNETSGYFESIDREPASTSGITVKDWNEDGTVKSFYRGTSALAIGDIHFGTDPVDGKTIFSECWWSTNYTPAFRAHYVDMTPVPMPTYAPEFPPFLIGSPDKFLHTLLNLKYVYDSAVKTESGDKLFSFGYQTDNNGRIVTLRSTDAKNNVTAFTFNYDNPDDL